MLLLLSHFFLPFIPLCPPPPLPPAFPHLISYPWVVYISSLASPFLILFLILFRYHCLFCTYHLCFFFPVPFSPFSTLHLPVDNPPCDLHFCDRFPVLVVCLVCFCFCFSGSVVYSCECVVILLFIVLMIFFFIDKSL